MHSSSGTTGKPVVVGYSRGDVNTWTELTARVAAAAGVQRGDLVQMAFPYGMSTGGWGLHYGIERIGATIIPAGAGQSERHLIMMRDFGTTVLVSTPSYALYLAEQAEELGVDFGALKLRLGLFGGEPCSDRMKAEIESRLGHPRHRQLRPLGGHGPRRRRRVRLRLRSARQRGPSAARDRRPGRAASRSSTAKKANS